MGHFQNFNYTRDAASVNIHYEMSFVIQREVIITSYAPTLPGFVPAEGGRRSGEYGKKRTDGSGFNLKDIGKNAVANILPF